MTQFSSIKLKNEIEQIKILTQKLDELEHLWNLPKDVGFDLNLSLEELITNTMFYGYDDGNEHFIEINFIIEKDFIKVEILDDGNEFNPLLLPEPDLTIPLNERRIGGLGIFLVKRIMDNVEYHRINSKNQLILIKSIKKKVEGNNYEH